MILATGQEAIWPLYFKEMWVVENYKNDQRKKEFTYLAKFVISINDRSLREALIIKSMPQYVKIFVRGVCLLEKAAWKQYTFYFDSLMSQKFLTVKGVKTREGTLLDTVLQRKKNTFSFVVSLHVHLAKSKSTHIFEILCPVLCRNSKF